METFLLLVLIVLLVGGIIWFVRKIELSDCGHDDCIAHCKHETSTPTQVQELPTKSEVVEVDFNAIRPGTAPVAPVVVVKDQAAKKPRKPRKPQQSQPVQQVQKAQTSKALANQPAKKAQPKPAARTAKPAKPKKPNN